MLTNPFSNGLRLVHAVAVAALLAAFAGNERPAQARAHAGGPDDVLYVANEGFPQFTVDVYPLAAVLANANPKPLRRIYGLPGPSAIAVDQDENFYVADRIANAVFVFKKGHIQPYRQIRIEISNPTDVAVGKDGTLFVLNTPSTRAASVVVYAPKADKPTRRIEKFQGVPKCLHADASGNLYVGTVSASGSGALEKFAPGATAGSIVTPALFPAPTSVAFDAAANLIVTGAAATTQGYNVSVLDVYQSGNPQISGTPNFAQHAVLTADESALLVDNGNAAAVYAYQYPDFVGWLGFLPTGINSYPVGIAVSPADPN